LIINKNLAINFSRGKSKWTSALTGTTDANHPGQIAIVSVVSLFCLMDDLQALRANLFVMLGLSKWHCSHNNHYYLFLHELHEHDDDGVTKGLHNPGLHRLWVYRMDHDSNLHSYKENDGFVFFEKDHNLFMRIEDMEFPIERTLNFNDTFVLSDTSNGPVTFTRLQE
jgi:hypothetical protein